MSTMKETNNTGLQLAFVHDDGNFESPFATFIVKGTYTLVPGGVCTRAPKQRAISDDQRHMDRIGRSLAWASDLAPFKPNSDFLIHGTFHQPGGVPRPEGRAAFSFGPLRKELAIFGRRTVVMSKGQRPAVTQPPPFLNLPLRWEYSAGGLRFRANPLGMGGDITTLPNGDQVGHMPLIERPDQLIRSINDRPLPINFAPLPDYFRFRRRKLGTRDQRWSLFRAPLPPEDFDPSYYNAAQHDQQGGNYPRGDETLQLWNLHPQHSDLTTRLPGESVRLAVLRRQGEGMVAEPVAMNLDTVVALPDEEQVVLVWRGRCPLRDRDAVRDLMWVWAEMEPLAGPPLAPTVQERLTQAWRGEQGAAAAAARAQAAREAAAAAALDAHVATTLQSVRTLLAAANLPPDLAQVIATESDPAVLARHLEAFIEDGLTKLDRMFPGVISPSGS
ncbi:MAG: DUF2169 domain-containing protein [Acetobacteraceae bacterium]